MDVGRHPNITLLNNSEVENVTGYIGNFHVQVRRQPRYVIEDKCTSCGDCAAVCPIQLPDEFNQGFSKRAAIYRSHTQAVPNSYLITKRGTSPCKHTCPADTSTQGYIALIAAGRYEEALEVIRQYNPFPAVLGRTCNHPCENVCNRNKIDEPVAICALKRFVADTVYSRWDAEGQDEAGLRELTPFPLAPKELPPEEKCRVAIVGSGPAGLTAAYFLVRMGYQATIFEALPEPGGMMRVGIPAYRLPRDVLNREINAILKLGVELKLNHPIRDINRLFQRGYSAIFLAIGAHEHQELGIPGEDVEGVFHGVPFLRAVNLGKDVRLGNRVVVVGGGNTAIDTARTALRLGSEKVTIAYRRSREEMPANSWEIDEAEEEGVRLQILTQPIEVLSDNGRVSGVRCIRMRLGDPDASRRRRPIPIEDSEFVIPCDTLVAAVAQSPEISLLGPDHRLEITRWNTFAVDSQTLATNRPGIFAGGDAAAGPGSLIEAIAAGRRGALSIDRFLREVPLLTTRDLTPLPVVELTQDEITGKIDRGEVDLRPRVKIPTTLVEERIRSFREVEQTLSEEQARAEALRCLHCGLCSECYQCVLACQAGAIDHQQTEEIVDLDVGSIIIATGYKMLDATVLPEYSYGKSPNILTSLEFERLVSAGGHTRGEILTSEGKKPEKVAIIHCVGSRDERTHAYCSRFCCMYSLKQAHQIKDKTGAEVYSIYMDMRTYGKDYEEFYRRIRNEGIHFIQGRPSQVTVDPVTGKLFINVEDILLSRVMELEVDMVVLATAIEPPEDADKIASTFGLGRTPDGWFAETHPKLRPVETATAGVFLAGCAQGPRDVPDTVAHAGAAALEVVRLFNQKEVTISPTVAVVNGVKCVGCGECILTCPYTAIVRGDNQKAEINPALCQGCGTCVATCPSGVITALHFTDDEIVAQIDGLLELAI